jgi:hypothetical protein
MKDTLDGSSKILNAATDLQPLRIQAARVASILGRLLHPPPVDPRESSCAEFQHGTLDRNERFFDYNQILSSFMLGVGSPQNRREESLWESTWSCDTRAWLIFWDVWREHQNSEADTQVVGPADPEMHAQVHGELDSTAGDELDDPVSVESAEVSAIVADVESVDDKPIELADDEAESATTEADIENVDPEVRSRAAVTPTEREWPASVNTNGEAADFLGRGERYFQDALSKIPLDGECLKAAGAPVLRSDPEKKRRSWTFYLDDAFKDWAKAHIKL